MIIYFDDPVPNSSQIFVIPGNSKSVLRVYGTVFLTAAHILSFSHIISVTKLCLFSSRLFVSVSKRHSDMKNTCGLVCDSIDSMYRYNQHMSDINTVNEEHTGTTLSEYVRPLIRDNIPHNIKWEIVKRPSPYNPIAKDPRLCISVKINTSTFTLRMQL